MSNATYKLGFVGGAPNSAVGYAHYVASQMDNRWKVAAGVFSRDMETNKEAAQIYGVDEDRVYPSLEKLLQQEGSRLDAVVLLTPTPLHHEMVVKCLNTGIPVICEKALCMTSTEAEEIKELCVKKNGFLAVTYNYSGYPMVREMRRMIREGILGDLLHFQAEMPQEGYIRTDDNDKVFVPQDWRLQDGQVPTIHLDLAVHLHELIHYLTELKPLDVVSAQASQGWFDVVDNVMCLGRYSQNVMGQFWFSKCALGNRNGLRLRLNGSKASLEWFQMNPEEVIVSYADGRRQIVDRASNVPVASQQRYQRFKSGHPAGFNEAFANLYVDIHDALQNYKKTGFIESDEIYGAELALEGFKWLEAMVHSCKSNRWESLL